MANDESRQELEAESRPGPVPGEAIAGGVVAGSFGGDEANQGGTALRVNTHVHVPPNFSAFASPEEAVGLAVAQGIRVLGTANYYDFRIYRRFEVAARSASIVPLFGSEFHTVAEDLYGIRINDPSNPGQFNLCGKGLTDFDPPTESAAFLIATMRAANALRMRTMAERLAQHFTEAGLAGGPSYKRIKATVARRSGVPEAWIALQERHLAEAFQELLFSSVPERDRPTVLDRLWGRQPAVDAADVVAVQEALRSHLLKFGKPAFVPESELTFEQAYRLVLDLGGIPCYPIFADAASSISEFEDPPEALVERMLDRRLYCAELFPSRNRPEIVDRYVLALRGAGIIVVAGTDHNTKQMTPLSPTAGGEPLSHRARRAFWEGTCVVAAHQELRTVGRPGYVDPSGALAAGFGDTETRIRWFAKAGEDAIETRTAVRAGHERVDRGGIDASPPGAAADSAPTDTSRAIRPDVCDRSGDPMNAPAQLHGLGQSLWLDNITRDLLDTGTLARYIADLSVTGLTSNPTIYDKAIGGTGAYDVDVREGAARGQSHEAIFFDLALADLRRAADLFAPIHARTGGVDGYVSLEVSPLLAHDAEATHAEALRLHGLGGRSNLFIKIPGTPEGLTAIEDTIFAGVPVNVTLLFSRAQYLACMEAYTRGIERRVEGGLPAFVGSVASVFISRLDSAVAGRVPDDLRNALGLAVGRQAYVEYRRFFATDRWQRLANEGARPQRLLFASTGTKDPTASDTLYVSGLAAPHTVNTMPEDTLLAFADHGVVGSPLDADPAVAAVLLARFTAAGIDVEAVGHELQVKGADAFVASWTSLLDRIGAKVGEVPARV